MKIEIEPEEMEIFAGFITNAIAEKDDRRRRQWIDVLAVAHETGIFDQIMRQFLLYKNKKNDQEDLKRMHEFEEILERIISKVTDKKEHA